MVFDNDQLRIGPTGVQKSLFKIKDLNGRIRNGKRREIPEYLTNKKLMAYEFPAGRLAKFSDTAENQLFRQNTLKYNLSVSFHAPYYISLTSDDEAIYNKSIERLAHSFAWATYLNAKRIVLHPGSYGKSRKKANMASLNKFMPNNSSKLDVVHRSKIDQIVEGIKAGMEQADKLYPELKSKFQQICLCPETMGKFGQIGTLSEIIEICKTVGLNRTRPCVDFGHLYARNLGKIPNFKFYFDVFDVIESELGSKVAQSLHIHYSIVEYGNKGEIKHHPNQISSWGPKVDTLFQIIANRQYTPIIINESPLLDVDAEWLQKMWARKQKSLIP